MCVGSYSSRFRDPLRYPRPGGRYQETFPYVLDHPGELAHRRCERDHIGTDVWAGGGVEHPEDTPWSLPVSLEVGIQDYRGAA